jgi:hypothetical protein
LSRFWRGWRHWVFVVKPDTVVRWHRSAFAHYWTWKSRRRRGRPAVAAAIRDLIQRMSRANVLWGVTMSAPHSRRTAQARDRRGSIDCGQISAPEP